nr:basic salivary proline-rich protein 3-like [Odocoileus virginianus texanus]
MNVPRQLRPSPSSPRPCPQRGVPSHRPGWARAPSPVGGDGHGSPGPGCALTRSSLHPLSGFHRWGNRGTGRSGSGGCDLRASETLGEEGGLRGSRFPLIARPSWPPGGSLEMQPRQHLGSEVASSPVLSPPNLAIPRGRTGIFPNQTPAPCTGSVPAAPTLPVDNDFSGRFTGQTRRPTVTGPVLKPSRPDIEEKGGPRRQHGHRRGPGRPQGRLGGVGKSRNVPPALQGLLRAPQRGPPPTPS